MYTNTGTKAKVTMPDDLPAGTKLKVDIKDVDGTIYEGLTPYGERLKFTLEFPEDSSTSKDEFILVLGYEENTDTEHLAIYSYNEDLDKWESKGGEIDEESQLITLPLPHFSTDGVFVKNKDDKDGKESKDRKDGKDHQDGQRSFDDNKLPITATNL